MGETGGWAGRMQRSAGLKARVPQASSRSRADPRNFFWLKPPQNDIVLGSEFFFTQIKKRKFVFDRWAPNRNFEGPDHDVVGQRLFWVKNFIFFIFYIYVSHIQKNSFFISSLSKNCVFFWILCSRNRIKNIVSICNVYIYDVVINFCLWNLNF